MGIDRYAREEMQYIWTDKHKYNTWLRIELLACNARNIKGEISDKELKKLQSATLDIDRIRQLEKLTKHDVVAFTRAISEQLGNEARWVHAGLTSSDIVDTSTGYILKQANTIIRGEINKLILTLGAHAHKHKNTLMIGRTHGIHGEPTTWGYKVALWEQEMKRNLKRFNEASKDVEVGMISGAMGTYSSVDEYVEKHVCYNMELTPTTITDQIVQRDRHAHYLSALSLITTSIEKFATEIRHLQRTEVREVQERFSKRQKGSSAMPHKQNPIGSENLAGISRIMRGYMLTAHENVNLWHERDISHSSAERIILPGATQLVDYALDRFGSIMKNLQINEDRMLYNIEETNGLIHSQRVMHLLISKGLTREQAYDMIQPITQEVYDQQIDIWHIGGGMHFSDALKANNGVMQFVWGEEIDEAMSNEWYIRKMDNIFNNKLRSEGHRI